MTDTDWLDQLEQRTRTGLPRKDDVLHLINEHRALAAKVAALREVLDDGPDTWEGYDTHDIGHAYLADSVLDFTAALRAALSDGSDQ